MDWPFHRMVNPVVVFSCLLMFFVVFGGFLLVFAKFVRIDHSSEWSILLLFSVACCFLLSIYLFLQVFVRFGGIDHSREWSILLLVFVVLWLVFKCF